MLKKISYATREILVKEKLTVDTKMTVSQIAFEGVREWYLVAETGTLFQNAKEL